jgi:hypothetical protein
MIRSAESWPCRDYVSEAVPPVPLTTYLEAGFRQGGFEGYEMRRIGYEK